MKLSLTLALALLGAVSARHLPEGTLEQEVPGELGSAVLEEELREPEPPSLGEGEGLTGRHKKVHYMVVKVPHTFEEAKKDCMQRFKGNLASIHGPSANENLRKQAQSYTKQAQVWIGLRTSSVGGRSFPHWVDQTNWNYAHWASGNPNPSGKICATLCTAGGHWRSASCEIRLPYICEY